QDNGILVDELCRTNAADIYAAGDVANHLHPVLGRIRVEHYNSAGHHGAAAARSMLGSAAPFDYIHNFWSDQYEHTLQYVGHATKWDDFVVRGNLAERKAVCFYLLGGVVRAAIGFDRGGDPEYEPESEMAACAQLVARRAQPDRGRLTDEDTGLRSLAGESGRPAREMAGVGDAPGGGGSAGRPFVLVCASGAQGEPIATRSGGPIGPPRTPNSSIFIGVMALTTRPVWPPGSRRSRSQARWTRCAVSAKLSPPGGACSGLCRQAATAAGQRCWIS